MKLLLLSLAVGLVGFVGVGKGAIKYITNVAYADVPDGGGGCGDGGEGAGGDSSSSGGEGEGEGGEGGY